MKNKLNKKIFLIIAVLFLVIGVTTVVVICKNGSDKSDETDLKTTPTGYPSDEVQFEQVMFNGRMYYYFADGSTVLPEGAELAGTIQKVDNKNEPAQDFEASRLAVGSMIYIIPDNADSIYVQIEGSEILYHKLSVR